MGKIFHTSCIMFFPEISAKQHIHKSKFILEALLKLSLIWLLYMISSNLRLRCTLFLSSHSPVHSKQRFLSLGCPTSIGLGLQLMPQNVIIMQKQQQLLQMAKSQKYSMRQQTITKQATEHKQQGEIVLFFFYEKTWKIKQQNTKPLKVLHAHIIYAQSKMADTTEMKKTDP